MQLDQSQIIRQDLRAFSSAVQNLVIGVKSASISWNDQNYQMITLMQVLRNMVARFKFYLCSLV